MSAPVQIDKVVRVNEFEIVKFQLMAHAFIKEIRLNETELNVLTLLGVLGETRLKRFCEIVTEKGYLANYTSANNCLTRISQSKLFLKKGVGKKLIYLNPEIGIHSKGTILLNYKLVKVESEGV